MDSKPWLCLAHVQGPQAPTRGLKKTSSSSRRAGGTEAVASAITSYRSVTRAGGGEGWLGFPGERECRSCGVRG